ncbi:hypothetical protein ACDQ55_00865 [Chitinophaga sp. 30R24]|uniref:hypothetical protein n=1 Tax=Chitinophaga sp. 30R24 TaxID=3248838 RepID=UPI003B8FA6D1
MTNLLKTIAGVALVALIATSCQKENTPQPVGNNVENSMDNKAGGVSPLLNVGIGEVRQIRNLESDSIIPPATPVPFYFSLSTATTVTASSPSRALLLDGYFNADISGVNGFTIKYIDTIAYSNITAANAVSASTAAVNNKVGYNATSPGWYNYFFNDNHKVLPVPDRTIIVYKTSGGAVTEIYKINMLSIYKDMPANPTGTEPIPYLSFDYQRLQ